MNSSALVNLLWRALKVPANAVFEALPPYHRVEGRLEAKEVGRNGSYLILIGGEMVEVDWLTFDTLKVGEALRARCTRSNKAITIDRLVPGGNGGK